MSSSSLAVYTQKMNEICAAIAARDFERALGYFDEKCVVVNGAGGIEGGKSALSVGFEEMIAAFPDWTPRVAASCLEGDTIVVLVEMTGTVAGTGSTIRWIGTGYSTFDPETHKIVRDVYFLDEAALAQKISDSELAS
ncbi:nuclear transport factor 2 family protein [Nocardia sp. NPDC060220]|uniref:nuclear transport factor 2 family protein n=1 Tax=Nocardia sp. NPDC060220 TaxID=3347076 RepID=UPI003669FB13